MLILPVGNIGSGRLQYTVSQRNSNVSLISKTLLKADMVSFGSISNIFRFGQVDETLYRGGRPLPEQLSDLKNLGISTIVDFSTERSRIPGYTEAEECAKLGIEHIGIPFVDYPSDDDVEKFFKVVEENKAKNKKMFIHCLEGKDRTGLFTELYKIKYGLSDVQTSINTLVKARYNFSEYPLTMNLLRDFANKIHH